MIASEYKRRIQELQDQMDIAMYGEENLHLVRYHRAADERRFKQIEHRGLIYEDADYFAASDRFLAYLQKRHKEKVIAEAMRGAVGLRELYGAARAHCGPWESIVRALAWRLGPGKASDE